jgi:hypothetical protein
MATWRSDAQELRGSRALLRAWCSPSLTKGAQHGSTTGKFKSGGFAHVYLRKRSELEQRCKHLRHTYPTRANSCRSTCTRRQRISVHNLIGGPFPRSFKMDLFWQTIRKERKQSGVAKQTPRRVARPADALTTREASCDAAAATAFPARAAISLSGWSALQYV